MVYYRAFVPGRSHLPMTLVPKGGRIDFFHQLLHDLAFALFCWSTQGEVYGVQILIGVLEHSYQHAVQLHLSQ